MEEGLRPEIIFVYGTLRKGQDHPMAGKLAKAGKWLGQATVCGLLYEIDGYPGLVGGDASVQGDLWELNSPDFLRELDAYEECGPGFPEPWEYFRDEAEADLDGKKVLAWAYYYNESLEGRSRIQSGDWLNRS